VIPTDHSHLRKYMATLGVAIVAGVVSVSALILRLQNDLLVKESELSQLTPLARETIVRRQHFAEVATTILPWFFVAGITLGIGVTSFGIYGWARRQRVTDQIEDTTRDRAVIELQALTQPERDQRLDAEAAAAIDSPQPAVLRTQDIRRRLVRLEEVLADKVGVILADVKRSVRLLGSPRTIEVDVVAESSRLTHIFELKYAANVASVRRRLDDAKSRVGEFAAVVGPAGRGYAIVVVPDEVAGDISASARAAWESHHPLVRVLVCGESEFEHMPAQEFASRLAIDPT